MTQSRRQQKDIRLSPMQHHKAKLACCPRCGAGPGMVCKSLQHKNVRPHLERIQAYEFNMEVR